MYLGTKVRKINRYYDRDYFFFGGGGMGDKVPR